MLDSDILTRYKTVVNAEEEGEMATLGCTSLNAAKNS